VALSPSSEIPEEGELLLADLLEWYACEGGHFHGFTNGFRREVSEVASALGQTDSFSHNLGRKSQSGGDRPGADIQSRNVSMWVVAA
jgi:hypothetical protein